MQRPHAPGTLSTSPVLAFYGFRGGAGGISNVMLNLMNALAGERQSVDLVLHNDDIPELARLDPSINIVRLGGNAAVTRVLRLRRYLRQRAPAVLVANREPANRAAILARWPGRAPVRVVFRVGTSIVAAMERRGFLKGWLRRQSIRFSYRRADLVIANAREVAREISMVTGLPLQVIRVLDNPTLPADFSSRAAEPVAHPWLQPGEPPVIMGVGRLIGTKGFDVLVRAFALVRRSRVCRLMILGEGKERGPLLELADHLGIAGDVVLPGHVDNSYAWMKHASLFVLSSQWEGSPNVLIEALALGVPVVATDCPGGTREIMADGRFGPLVPVAEPAAMAAAMDQLLDSPPERAFLQSAVTRFQAPNSARAYLAALGMRTYE